MPPFPPWALGQVLVLCQSVYSVLVHWTGMPCLPVALAFVCFWVLKFSSICTYILPWACLLVTVLSWCLCLHMTLACPCMFLTMSLSSRCSDTLEPLLIPAVIRAAVSHPIMASWSPGSTSLPLHLGLPFIPLLIIPGRLASLLTFVYHIFRTAGTEWTVTSSGLRSQKGTCVVDTHNICMP